MLIENIRYNNVERKYEVGMDRRYKMHSEIVNGYSIYLWHRVMKCFVHHEYLAAEMNEFDPLVISHMEKGEAGRFDCSGYRWFAAKISIE
jgi:hypothetical protein